MAAVEESTDNLFMIDEDYEFSAPHYFDFILGEGDEDLRRAELWFEKSVPYAPSPFMLRIKATREIQPQILCNFDDDENKLHETVGEIPTASDSLQVSGAKILEQSMPGKEVLPGDTTERNAVETGKIPCENELKVDNVVFSSLNSRKQTQKSQAKSNAKPGCIRRDTNIQKSSGASNFANENQAIKRQKLEGGKSHQILSVTKTPNLPHKTRAWIITSSNNFSIRTNKTSKEELKGNLLVSICVKN